MAVVARYRMSMVCLTGGRMLQVLPTPCAHLMAVLAVAHLEAVHAIVATLHTWRQCTPSSQRCGCWV